MNDKFSFKSIGDLGVRDDVYIVYRSDADGFGWRKASLLCDPAFGPNPRKTPFGPPQPDYLADIQTDQGQITFGYFLRKEPLGNSVEECAPDESIYECRFGKFQKAYVTTSAEACRIICQVWNDAQYALREQLKGLLGIRDRR